MLCLVLSFLLEEMVHLPGPSPGQFHALEPFFSQSLKPSLSYRNQLPFQLNLINNYTCSRLSHLKKKNHLTTLQYSIALLLFTANLLKELSKPTVSISHLPH